MSIKKLKKKCERCEYYEAEIDGHFGCKARNEALFWYGRASQRAVRNCRVFREKDLVEEAILKKGW